MVEQQLRARGISDSRVLQAMLEIPRHLFVPEAMKAQAYRDSALPIGEGQTISQPWMVARMCELLCLQGHERVLEIGTGCGYHTAILARLCARVYSIERIRNLHQQARQHLRSLHIGNVILQCADGCHGLPGFAPFDAIIVTAGGHYAPAWIEQLAEGGILLIPEGENGLHQLVSYRKKQGTLVRTTYEACSFVPLRSGVQS